MGLTEKQKKNLPVALQKAILNSQKKKEKMSIRPVKNVVKKAKEGGQLHGKDLKAMYKKKAKK